MTRYKDWIPNLYSLFLYCSLYPGDYSIDICELVLSWMAEGLLDKLRNFENSYNRGIALIESLKDACLLERGATVDKVKMHDVVRDVAIWFSSSLEGGFESLVCAGIGLKHAILDDQLSEKKISFIMNNLSSLPDHLMQCPEASTLLIQGNISLDINPDGFFMAFKALRVLNLSGANITMLPPSLSRLVELQTLLLRRCERLEELPPLEHLSRPQVLDCSHTALKGLPQGIEELTSLRFLDISNTIYLESIRPGVLSKLSSLEVLNMIDNAYIFGKVENSVEMQPLSELEVLDRLSVLSIRAFVSLIALGNLDWIERLTKFFIGSEGYGSPELDMTEAEYDDKMAGLSHLSFSGVYVRWLSNASCLQLYYCSELEGIPASMGQSRNFKSLRSLHIHNNTDKFPLRLFELCLCPKLEKLRLSHVDNLDCISCTIGLEFPKLRILEVVHCLSLKNFFSIEGSVKILKNIEVIDIKNCHELEELFVYGSSSQSHPDRYSNFPKLWVLELWDLPKLHTLCEQQDSWQQLEMLEVHMCDKIRKLPLTTQSTQFIKHIKGNYGWWNQLEWDDEHTKSSLQQYFCVLQL